MLLCSCFLQAILGNEHTSAGLTSSQGVTTSPPRASSVPTDTFIADFGKGFSPDSQAQQSQARGLFHQCWWWHLIAGLTSHFWQLPADLLPTSTLCSWMKILLHSNPQDFIKKAEIPKALFGAFPQSLWLLTGRSIARRGSQTAKYKICYHSCSALSSGVEICKRGARSRPKTEQSGIRCRYLFERTHTAKERVCSDHSRYCFKSQRN